MINPRERAMKRSPFTLQRPALLFPVSPMGWAAGYAPQHSQPHSEQAEEGPPRPLLATETRL